MNHINVMKQALEALEWVINGGPYPALEYKAVENLRKAIEEAEKVEPVAVVDYSDCFTGTVDWTKDNLPHGTKLYTAPPQRDWLGLTDDEIRDIHWSQPMDEYGYARAIEAKLKEKNS
jgi:hypothetical protein